MVFDRSLSSVEMSLEYSNYTFNTDNKVQQLSIAVQGSVSCSRKLKQNKQLLTGLFPATWTLNPAELRSCFVLFLQIMTLEDGF